MKNKIKTQAGALAFPAWTAEGKREELAKLGLKGRKATVAVYDYVIDMLVFGNGSAKGQLDAVMAASVLKVPVRKSNLIWGMLDDRRITIALPPAKPVVLKDDSKVDAAEKRKRNAVLHSYRRHLQTFTQLTGHKAVVNVAGGNIRAPIPDEPGTANFFLNAAPPGDVSSRWEAMAFGLSINNEDQSVICNGPTAGRGLVLKDGRGSPMVQVLGLNFYLLIPVIGHYHSQISRQIFGKLLAKAWEGRQAALFMKDVRRRPTRRAFAETVFGWTGYVEKNFRDLSEKYNLEIEATQRKLAELYRQKRIHEAMVAQFAAPGFRKAMKFRPQADFDALRADPDLAGMHFEDDGLHLETVPLVIIHDGRRYSVGQFTIRLGHYGSVAVWSDAPRHPQGVPHPHIAKNGVPCYGNASDAIMKAAGELRVADLFRLAVRWLRDGYSPESAEVKIEEWPADAEMEREKEIKMERANEANSEAPQLLSSQAPKLRAEGSKEA